MKILVKEVKVRDGIETSSVKYILVVEEGKVRDGNEPISV